MPKRKVITTLPSGATLAIARHVKQRSTQHPRGTTPISGRQFAEKHCFARVSSSAQVLGAYQHAWTEVRWKLSTNDWENVPDGLSGTTAFNYLVQQNGEELTAGEVYFARRNDDETGANVWATTATAPAAITPIQRLTITGGPTLADPRIVVAGGHSVACAAGHRVGDAILACEPNGGAPGVDGYAWAEVGVVGQEFRVMLGMVSGAGTPSDPFKYDVYVGTEVSSNKIAEELAPVFKPAHMSSVAAATRGLARFIPGSGTGIVELTVAFETRVPVEPVALSISGGTIAPGGVTPSSRTYTATSLNATTLGTGLTPLLSRPFGDDFNLITGATVGTGYHDVGGTFVLLDANEKFASEGC